MKIPIHLIDHTEGDPSVDTALDRCKPMLKTLRSGGKLPPISVFQNGDRYHVVDGNARLIAHRVYGSRRVESVLVANEAEARKRKQQAVAERSDASPQEAKEAAMNLSAAWLAAPEISLSATEAISLEYPRTVGGKPAHYYWKDVLAVGNYVHPKTGFKFDIQPSDLKTLERSATMMLSSKHEPPVVKDHKENSDNTLGYIKAARVRDNRLQMLHQFIGDDARDLALRNKVSAKIVPKHRISNGEVLPIAITHVSTTPVPVISDQTDWSIAASAGSESDDAPVLILAAASGDPDMKISPEQMQKVKAIAPDATEESAFDLLLSAANTAITERDTLKTKLESQPSPVELSATEKTLLGRAVNAEAKAFEAEIGELTAKGHMPRPVAEKMKAALRKDGEANHVLLSSTDGEPNAIEFAISLFRDSKLGAQTTELSGAQILPDPVKSDDKSKTDPWASEIERIQGS